MSLHDFHRVLTLVVALMVGCEACHLAATAKAGDSFGVEFDERPTSEGSKSAVGWIQRTSGLDIPAPFVLTDRSGAARYFLRPAPGMSLGRLVNQRVRVRGTEVTLANESIALLEIDEVGPYDTVLGPQMRDDRRGYEPPARPVRQASVDERMPAPRRRGVEIITTADTGDGYGEPVAAPTEKLEPRPDPLNDDPGGPDTFGFSAPIAGDCGGSGCGAPSCPSCRQPCGWPGRFWVRGEYLFWWTQGMHLPPLVTTGPSSENPGYLGSPGTQILFGDGTVNGYGRSGGRITMGTWLNPCQTIGIEGDYFSLANAFTNYSASSSGSPILSRPFFDVRPDLAAQNVEQVALPGSIDGTVSVKTLTTFQSAGLRMLFNLCCSGGCACGACLPGANGPSGCRVDFLLGYRYMQLTDSIGINENLNSLNPDFPGTFYINDSFATRNVFNGVEFGTSILRYRGRWSFQALSKLALGVTSQTVNINGSTVTDQGGVITTSQGGLLALSSNIGQYTRNAFGVIPELGINVGYAITPRLRFLVGYTFIYWSQVLRAGDQINTNVNSTLLPNSPNPPTGDLRQPQFVFHETDFWAQGISLGLDYRW